MRGECTENRGSSWAGSRGSPADICERLFAGRTLVSRTSNRNPDRCSAIESTSHRSCRHSSPARWRRKSCSVSDAMMQACEQGERSIANSGSSNRITLHVPTVGERPTRKLVNSRCANSLSVFVGGTVHLAVLWSGRSASFRNLGYACRIVACSTPPFCRHVATRSVATARQATS